MGSDWRAGQSQGHFVATEEQFHGARFDRHDFRALDLFAFVDVVAIDHRFTRASFAADDSLQHKLRRLRHGRRGGLRHFDDGLLLNGLRKDRRRGDNSCPGLLNSGRLLLGSRCSGSGRQSVLQRFER